MDTTDWKKHRFDFAVQPHQVDHLGHMNNVQYFQVFEDARWAMIASRAYDAAAMEEAQKGPVILKIETEFRKEVLLGKAYFVETSTASYEAKIFQVVQELKSDGDVVHARALYTMGLFDMLLRKLVLPTDAWLRACGKAF